MPGVLGEVFVDLAAPFALGTVVLDASGEGSVALTAPQVAVPSLAAVQWVEASSPPVVSNAAFVSLL